jgi:hypothetical protein
VILLESMKRFSGILGACVVACAMHFAGCDDANDGSTIVVDTDAQAGTSGTAGGAGSGGTMGSGGSGIDLDATGGSGGSGDAMSCGDFGNNEACSACLAEDCCRETAACAANTDCAALVACAGQCPMPSDGTSPCVRACAMDNQDGITAYNGALLCMGMDMDAGKGCSHVCSHL